MTTHRIQKAIYKGETVGIWELVEYDEQLTWTYTPKSYKQPSQKWLYFNRPTWGEGHIRDLK